MSEQRVVTLEKRVLKLEKEFKFLRDKLVELSGNVETPGERRQAALERHKLNYERQVTSTVDVTCDCGGDDEIDANQNQPVNLETWLNELMTKQI
jgi:predicted nuclease with TOPRIM domain